MFDLPAQPFYLNQMVGKLTNRNWLPSYICIEHMIIEFFDKKVFTVDFPNSKCLNSKQSLTSKHFWWHRLFYNINYMLNSKLHKICQPLNSKLKFWNFPLFYHIIYAIYVNKRYLCPKNGKTMLSICYGVLWILQLVKTKI